MSRSFRRSGNTFPVRALAARVLAAAVAVGGAGTVIPACGGPEPAAEVSQTSAALNLSLPGRGSGLLWRASNGDLHVWDMMASTNYEDFLLGATIPAAWQTVATGDFNGDGAGDIIWRERPDLLAAVWSLNDTTVAPSPPGTAGAPSLSGPTFAGDMDGDGVSDVIWTGTITSPPPVGTTYFATIWPMNGGSTAPLSSTTISSTTDAVVAVGNFDGDASHRADLLRRSSSGGVSVAVSGGGVIQQGNVSSDWVVKGVGDFNGDQTSDIVWYNTTSGMVSIWIMQNGSLAASPVPGGSAPSAGWTVQGVADVDHDGISDIVWRHSTGLVSIWMMASATTVREYGPGIALDPSTSFAGVVELGPPPYPSNVAVSSVGFESGKTNINVTFNDARPNEQVEAWENNGGTFTFRQRVPYVQSLGTAMSAKLDASLFQAGTRACFELRVWAQGRVSYLSDQVCAQGLPPPVPAIEWQVQDQFGLDDDHDGAVDVTPGLATMGALRTGRWPVTLDACGSTDPASGTITSYSWSISNLPTGTLSLNSSTCKISGLTLAGFPKGSFPAQLNVTTQDGRSAFIRRTITVNNYLIVSLGDSYASGEGNPVRPAVWNGPVDPSSSPAVPASWGSARDTICHRTANSGPARAALALERSDPHSSVTFLSTACTGAIAANLIDSAQTTDQGHVALSQIQQVQNALCPPSGDIVTIANCAPSAMPQIDALLISITGNDVTFSNIIQSCAGVSDAECRNDPFFTGDEERKLTLVAGKLSSLNTALAKLNAAQIYITEYPDSVHFDPADVCDQIELEGAISVTTHGFSGILHDAVISHEDLLWAVDFIHRLNVKISNGAIVFGWNFVTGVADAFASHGYCNMDTWTVHYGQSWVNQDDQNGTLHPNNMGHNGYATQILQAMLAHGVGSANVTSFIPPGPVRWVPPI